MAPSDVSSIVLRYDTAKASGIISTVVGNLHGYADVAGQIQLGAIISKSLTAERLRIEDLVHPPPRAYYLRPEGAPGCNSLVQNPECGTIFEGAYRAIISLPSEVSLLQGDWKTCNPAIYGVYDPPIALTEAASVAKPTLPGGHSLPAEMPAAPTRARPYTITPPLVTAAQTALRDTLPSATDNSVMHSDSTLLAPNASPSSDDNDNGGQSSSASSVNGHRPNGQADDSSSEEDQSVGRPSPSSNEEDEAGGEDSPTAGEAESAETSGETVATISESDGPATTESRGGSSSQDRTHRTATADQSASRETQDASSSTSAPGALQSSLSPQLSVGWMSFVGTIFLVLNF